MSRSGAPSRRTLGIAFMTMLVAIAIIPFIYGPSAIAEKRVCESSGSTATGGFAATVHCPGNSDNPLRRTVLYNCNPVNGINPCPSICPTYNTNVVKVLIDEVKEQGRWRRVGDPYCPGLEEGVGIADLTDTATRLLPVPGILRAPPASGLALVGVDVIYWLGVDEGQQTLKAAELAGYHVEFRVQVASARWDFGDGHGATSVGGGRPYDLQVNPCRTRQCLGYFTHAYTEKGQYTVTATASWTAQYRVDGGGWTDLGTIAGRQMQIPVHVYAARSILVEPEH